MLENHENQKQFMLSLLSRIVATASGATVIDIDVEDPNDPYVVLMFEGADAKLAFPFHKEDMEKVVIGEKYQILLLKPKEIEK